MILGALLGTAATQAANLGTAMIVARALLPEGRGDLQLVVLWPMLAAQIASLSLNEALLVLTASRQGDARRLFATAIYLAGALAAWLAGAGLAGFALAFLVSHLLAMAAAGGRLTLRGWFAAGRPDRPTASRLAGLGARLHLGFVVQVLGGRVDQIAIAMLLEPTDLGLYAAAMTLVLGLLQLAASVSQAMFPRVLALAEQGARAKAVRLALALVLAGILAAALALYGLADLVVHLLFGPAFTSAADLVRLLLIGIVPHASRDVLMVALKAEGRPLAIGQAEIVSLVFFGTALALLVPRFGAAGAAMAYAATQWLVALALAWQSRALLTARAG
jgi:O-antigen/teichoic acid export membrane protein